MTHHRWADPVLTSQADARAVLAAYDRALAAGAALVDRYLAGVTAWLRRHPDHTRQYAGTCATEVILAHRLPSLWEIGENCR